MKVTVDDLDALALGVTVLGSGGGGDPGYDILLAREQMSQYGPVDLVSIDQIPHNEWVLPIFIMGAPLVSLERLHSGEEFMLIVRKLEALIPCKVGGLVSAEVGGANGIPPFYAAPALGLPVVDADAMGRAFPTSYMTSYELFGLPPGPGVIVDTASNAIATINASNSEEMERILRGLTTAMGSDAAACSHPMTQPTAKKALLHGTVSSALRLGQTMLAALAKQADPVDAILDVCGGCILASGVITDIEHWIESCFQKGRAKITGSDGTIIVCFQNEFLAVLNEDIPRPLATTPDIIVILEIETGLPVTVERLRYGLRVQIIALPAPEIWTTPQGLQLVGPAAFGFDWEYLPVG